MINTVVYFFHEKVWERIHQRRQVSATLAY